MNLTIIVVISIVLLVLFVYLNYQAPKETPANITENVAATIEGKNITSSNVTETEILPAPPS